MENKIGKFILVYSNKGGVGKTFVAVNLANSLKMLGNRVGVMDASFFSPDIPSAFGDRKAYQQVVSITGEDGSEREMITPVDVDGIPVVSVDFMLEESNQCIAWRGPTTHGPIRQFLHQTIWQELDFLVIDMPVATSDVHQSLSMLVKNPCVVHVVIDDSFALKSISRGMSFYRMEKPSAQFVVLNNKTSKPSRGLLDMLKSCDLDISVEIRHVKVGDSMIVHDQSFEALARMVQAY